MLSLIKTKKMGKSFKKRKNIFWMTQKQPHNGGCHGLYEIIPRRSRIRNSRIRRRIRSRILRYKQGK